MINADKHFESLIGLEVARESKASMQAIASRRRERASFRSLPLPAFSAVDLPSSSLMTPPLASSTTLSHHRHGVLCLGLAAIHIIEEQFFITQ